MSCVSRKGIRTWLVPMDVSTDRNAESSALIAWVSDMRSVTFFKDSEPARSMKVIPERVVVMAPDCSVLDAFTWKDRNMWDRDEVSFLAV